MTTFKPDEPETNIMTQPRDPFGLAALPQLQPAQDGWSAVSARLQQDQQRRQHWIYGLALAATVTLAVGIVALRPPTSDLPTPAESMLAAEQEGSSDAADLTTPDNLQAMQKLSQRLEQNLAYLRTGVGAMPAELVVYQVELEDLVAQVDAAISQQPDSGVLWQQRVNLLLDLNQIYGAGLRRDEPYVASL
jgi:hypothetical protein